jgi:tight adherence protein C
MPDVSILIALLGAASAFLFAISLIPTKNTLTQRLEELERRREAASDGNAGTLTKIIDEVFSSEKTGELSRKLIEAGWYTVSPRQIVLRMIAGGFAGVVLVLLLGRVLHAQLPVLFTVLVDAIVFISACYAPMWLLERAVEERKNQVQRALPDFLDMVASTVMAGLSVNSALTYAIDSAPGALGDELKEALSEVRLGRSRADALKAAAKRLNQPEFTTTISAITQAERLGANVSKILGELAEDVRNHRIMVVEEHAAKLPVMMVFPMAFFFLPSLFVLIFGTLLANYFSQPTR